MKWTHNNTVIAGCALILHEFNASIDWNELCNSLKPNNLNIPASKQAAFIIITACNLQLLKISAEWNYFNYGFIQSCFNCWLPRFSQNSELRISRIQSRSFRICSQNRNNLIGWFTLNETWKISSQSASTNTITNDYKQRFDKW
jgi:hypothetical protein